MKAPDPTPGHDFTLSLADLPDVLTLAEAAAALSTSGATLRAAIKAGDLAAFIPRGRDPRRAGRAMGYRIHKADLQRWYFR